MRPANREKRHKIGFRWLWILLIQSVSFLVFGALIALTLYLGKTLHMLCIWGIAPLAGAVSACLATRKGLNNYAAWIVPPLMLLAGYMLVWGVPLQPGPVFVCGLVSIVGAATGHVLKTRK